MQMAGRSEKEASIMVGATPEVMRRHYEKLDQHGDRQRNVRTTAGRGWYRYATIDKILNLFGALLAREDREQVG